jgi:hypothetical protein
MVRFILQMSDGRFLGQDLNWTADLKKTPIYQFEYYDVALNKLIELNAKDITLRIKMAKATLLLLIAHQMRLN